jgi:hypothetical protein
MSGRPLLKNGSRKAGKIMRGSRRLPGGGGAGGHEKWPFPENEELIHNWMEFALGRGISERK